MQKEEYSHLALILLLVTAIFMFIECLIWVDVIDIPTLGNLNNKLNQVFENPAFVGLTMTFIVGVASGFMENWSMTREAFDPNKFAETFFYYEPLLILFAQSVPIKEAVVLTFALDVLRRIATRLTSKQTLK